MRTRGFLAPLATVAMLAAASPASGRDACAPNRLSRGVAQLPAVGYALPGLPERVIERDAHALATVGVDGVTILESGERVLPPDQGDGAPQGRGPGERPCGRTPRQQLQLPHRRLQHTGPRPPAHVACELSTGSQAHSPAWPRRRVGMASPSTSRCCARAHADGLVRFVRMLDHKLADGITLDIDLSASTHYRRGGYDVPKLLHHVDRIVLMAYSQHGPTWSGPGPMGSLRWQRQTLGALLELAPADRVDLGVAGYGYTWPRATAAPGPRRQSAQGPRARRGRRRRAAVASARGRVVRAARRRHARLVVGCPIVEQTGATRPRTRRARPRTVAPRLRRPAALNGEVSPGARHAGDLATSTTPRRREARFDPGAAGP